MKIIRRYVPSSLSKHDKIRQRKMILTSRRLYRRGKYYTRKSVKSFSSKPSKHVSRAKKMYNVDDINASSRLSKATGCTRKGLLEIIRKGEGAYYSSGSRPNQTPQSWGKARLASAITGGNASKVDFHIINNECSHRKSAYRLAQKPKTD